MEKFLRKIQLVTKMNPGNVIPWPAYHWFKALKGSCFQESQVRTLKTVAISSPSAYPILNSLIHLSTASTVYHLQQYFWSISRLFELLSKLFRNVIRHAYSNLPTGTWKVILITCARGHIGDVRWTGFLHIDPQFACGCTLVGFCEKEACSYSITNILDVDPVNFDLTPTEG